jgi:hypothetical protein
MKAHERGWFEDDGRAEQPGRANDSGKQSGNDPVAQFEIGCSPPRAIEDQELMLEQEGFGYDGARTAGPNQFYGCISDKNVGSDPACRRTDRFFTSKR